MSPGLSSHAEKFMVKVLLPPHERCLSHPRLFRLPYISLLSCSCCPGSDTSAMRWKKLMVTRVAIWGLPGKSHWVAASLGALSAYSRPFEPLSLGQHYFRYWSFTLLRDFVTTRQRRRKLDQTKRPEFYYVPSSVSPSLPYGICISRVPCPSNTPR